MLPFHSLWRIAVIIMNPYHFSIIHSLISSIPVMPMKWDLGHVPIIILIVIPLFPIVLF